MIYDEELPVIDRLGELGIEYTRIEHGAARTMEDCESIGRDIGARHVKNLFLTNRQQTEFYLVLICAKKKFRTAEVSKQLGVSRLSFASPELLMEKLHLLPGSVTAMALIYDKAHEITVAVDEDIKHFSMLCVHPCISSVSYAISGADLMKYLDASGNIVRFVNISSDGE